MTWALTHSRRSLNVRRTSWWSLDTGNVKYASPSVLDIFGIASEVVSEASQWVQSGLQAAPPYVTVNLSAHQFQDPGLVAMIEGELSASGGAPNGSFSRSPKARRRATSPK